MAKGEMTKLSKDAKRELARKGFTAEDLDALERPSANKIMQLVYRKGRDEYHRGYDRAISDIVVLVESHHIIKEQDRT